MHLRFTAHSETGPVRKNNQDSGYASSRLLVVADGMGGAAAGDLASAVAADLFRRLDSSAGEAAGEDMLELLAGAISRSNAKIADLVADDPNLEGMGTTVSAYMFDGHALGVAHIGDSRGYLFRDGELRRTTHDHSWVQSLIDEGKITEDEAATHPHRNLLLKVINGQPQNEPDLDLIEVRPGDRLLLCSDGLCGLVDDQHIGAALSRRTLLEAMDELIDLAYAGGGIDNITVLLADVLADPGETYEQHSIGSADDPEATADPSDTATDRPDPTTETTGDDPDTEASDSEASDSEASDSEASDSEASDSDDPGTHGETDKTGTDRTGGDPVTNPDGSEDTLVRVPAGPDPIGGPATPTDTTSPDADTDAGSAGHPSEDLPTDPVILGAATERVIPAVRDRTPDERAAALADEQILVSDSPTDPQDEEEARYALSAPPRLRWLRIAIAVVLAVIILLIGGLASNAWINTQYYVGASAERVAIFRGIPDSVAGLNLSQVYETTDTQVSDLPVYYRQRVTETIPASDLLAARNTADELAQAAQTCIAQRDTEAPLDPRTSASTPPRPAETDSPDDPGTQSPEPTDQDTESATPTTTPTQGPGGECG